MTQWIELTKTFQDGTPQTKAIKIPGMGEEIWFTDNAYAEVSDTVADLLASQNDFIDKVSAPGSPGTYYESAPQNAQVTLTLPNGAFDHITADSIDVDSGLSLADVAGTDLSLSSLDSAGPVTAPSIETGRVLNTEDYAVAYTKGYAAFVDPAGYADDSAAIQALNDDLVANMPSGFDQGVIRIPPLKPDDTQWNFPSTVTLGTTDSTTMVALQGTQWAAGAGVTPWTTSITDGSPVFHIAGDLPGNTAIALQMPVGGFYMNGGQGQDVEALRLTNVLRFNLRDIRLQNFAQGDVSEGVVVFEGSCFNSEVDRIHYIGFNPGTTNSVKTDVFRFVSRTGVLGPGEIVFGPGVRARQGIGYMFNDEGATDATSIYWHGHTERWEQDYAFNIVVSSLRIGNDAIFGHPDETSVGGNVLNFEGAVLSVSENSVMGAPSDNSHAIRVGNATAFYILPFDTFGPGTGVEAIKVESNPARPSCLPYEQNVRGTIDAIGGTNVRFPDGAKPGGDGTTTVPTGGSVTEIIGGNQSYDPIVKAYAQSDPGATFELDKSVYYDSTAGNWKVDFSWATDPGVNVTFDYESRFYGG